MSDWQVWGLVIATSGLLIFCPPFRKVLMVLLVVLVIFEWLTDIANPWPRDY